MARADGSRRRGVRRPAPRCRLARTSPARLRALAGCRAAERVRGGDPCGLGRGGEGDGGCRRGTAPERHPWRRRRRTRGFQARRWLRPSGGSRLVPSAPPLPGREKLWPCRPGLRREASAAARMCLCARTTRKWLIRRFGPGQQRPQARDGHLLSGLPIAAPQVHLVPSAGGVGAFHQRVRPRSSLISRSAGTRPIRIQVVWSARQYVERARARRYLRVARSPRPRRGGRAG